MSKKLTGKAKQLMYLGKDEEFKPRVTHAFYPYGQEADF